MEQFTQKLIQCESLRDAVRLIATEVLASTHADNVLVLLPVCPADPSILEGYRARKEGDQTELTAIHSGFLPQSLGKTTTETEISRSKHEGEPISLGSIDDRALSNSIASFTCPGITENVLAYLIPLEGANGVIELVFMEDLEDDSDQTLSKAKEALLPPEEETLVKVIKMNAFYVLKHLRAAESESIQRRTDDIVLKLVQQVANSPNKLKAIELIRHSAMQLVDAAYVSFFLIDFENQWVRLAESDRTSLKKWPLSENSLVGYCALSGQSINIGDISSSPRCERAIDCCECSTATSFLGVPIRGHNGEIVAVIVAKHRAKPHYFTDVVQDATDGEVSPFSADSSPYTRDETWAFHIQDEQLLQKLGTSVGSVLGRVDAFYKLEREREIKEAVLVLVRAVTRGEDFQSVLHCIVNAAYKIAHPELVSLYLVDHSRQELWLAMSEDISGRRLSIDGGIASCVAREGKTVLIEDAYADPRFDGEADMETELRTKQVLCVPISLVTRSSPIAVLQLANKSDDLSFTEEDQEAMETFCDDAAVALKRMSMEAVFLKVFEEEDEFSRSRSFNRIPSSIGPEGVNRQPYQVRELSAALTGAKGSSPASAASRRFHVSLLQSFSDDTTFGKLHSGFASTKVCLSSLSSSPDDSPPSRHPHLLNRYSEHSGASRDDWVQKWDLDMSKEKQLFQWHTDILSLNFDELKGIALQTFHCWNLPSRFDISIDKLRNFIDDVQKNYHPHPFHNFYHAVETLRATLLILARTEATTCLSYLDIFSMLVASFCHDVDHPGNSQAYEVLTLSSLAMQHNDSSVLERHHAHTTFRLLSKGKNNILGNLTSEEFRHCRKIIISAILGTDMARHFSMVSNLSARAAQYSADLLQYKQEGFHRRSFEGNESNPISFDCRKSSEDNLKRMFSANRGETRDAGPGKENPGYPTPFKREKEDDRLQLIEAVVHTADLSAQTMPYAVASRWGDMVIEEFKQEAEKFKSANLEEQTPPFMRNLETTYDKHNLQASFVEKIVLPLWENMFELLGGLYTPVKNLQDNLNEYKSSLEDVTEVED